MVLVVVLVLVLGAVKGRKIGLQPQVIWVWLPRHTVSLYITTVSSIKSGDTTMLLAMTLGSNASKAMGMIPLEAAVSLVATVVLVQHSL